MLIKKVALKGINVEYANFTKQTSVKIVKETIQIYSKGDNKMKNIKKKVLILLLCCALLSGCGTTIYNQSQEMTNNTFASGYFITIREWNDNEGRFRIVYASDTKVKYLVWITGYKASITPLYNTDGSLQIYKEETKEL